MLQVDVNAPETKSAETLGQILQARALELDVRRQEKEKYAPIPTHIPALNNVIVGIPRAEPFYMLLLSSEKIGKTTIAMDFAEAWRKGLGKEKVAYFQLEELRSQFADRTFAANTNITRTDIRKFEITDEQMKEMYDFAQRTSEGDDNLLVQDDIFGLRRIEKEMDELGLTCAVIDNLQLIDQEGWGGRTAQEVFAAISKYIVQLRNRRGFSFIVVSQMATKSKAFGSGQANRDADLLIEIEKIYASEDDDEPVEGQRRLRVLDSRIAPSGHADVAFDGSKNRISPLLKVDVNSKDFLEIARREGPNIRVVA